MIRIVKILFMLSIATWGVLGAIANLMAYPDGYYSVQFTFSMQGAANAPGLWRAIENPLLIHLGFAVIWGSKLAGGLLASYGTLQMWSQRQATAKAFDEAKNLWAIRCSHCVTHALFRIRSDWWNLFRIVEGCQNYGLPRTCIRVYIFWFYWHSGSFYSAT